MLLVDTADQALILEAMKSPAVHGFTTNPTLMARAASVEQLSVTDYIARGLALCRMANTLPSDKQTTLMIQGVGTTEAIIEQAGHYHAALTAPSSSHLWIKLPPTLVGLKACSALKKMGCSTLVTAIYTPAQALVALEAGADGIAVYLGRMIRLEPLWAEQLDQIAKVVKAANRLLLLASFPALETVDQGLPYSHDLTVPPAILTQLLDSPHTAAALKDFDSKIAF